MLRTLRRLRHAWSQRVAVEGGSMLPALHPGDWLLVDTEAYEGRPPRPGEVVVVPDPRHAQRWLVKRVASTAADGRLVLVGDRPDASTDSRTFGTVDPSVVIGRAWLRYWPPRRIGRVR